MKIALLGLDVGTTSTKAVLFGDDGKEIARAASSPYTNHTPYPGWVEQDPQEVWKAVLQAIQSVMAGAGEDVQAQALCMAAQSGSLLPADDQGHPVYPLITWMDGRTEEIVGHWRAEGVQEQVRPRSGWSLYPGLCLPTIAWLHQHDPETFSAAHHYFSVNDFIAYRLTGEYCTNPSNGGGMQLIDIHTGKWSDELCALAKITPKQLSRIQPSGTIIGEVKSEICRSVGLPEGTVLINGGHDQGCTALGLGITNPGKILLACGTAWVLTGVTDFADINHIPAAMDMNFHVLHDQWTISQSLGGLGASLEWWINQAWRGTDEQASHQVKYAALDEELNNTELGSDLHFLPLTGGHDNPATTQRGGFLGLQLSDKRADMARAIMKSAAFELNWALENIRRVDLPVERLSMVGGAAQSQHWPGILTDATGIPISLPDYDNWPALGAAILAGVGIGIFETAEDGIARFQRSTRDIASDETHKGLYDKQFEIYKEKRSKNK